MNRVHPDPGRFFDGGVDAGPHRPQIAPDRQAPPQIVLRGLAEDAMSRFAMQRRIGYDDRELGVLLVPRTTGSFRTDLTSVPTLFTWLVPRVGRYLPAALVHDGLVHAAGSPPTYTSVEGHDVLRPQADRVLRDAMADTGTDLVRRWLVWSAVSTATIFSTGRTGWSRALTWRLRAAAALSLLAVGVIGVLATLDLFDVTDGLALPWMGDRGLWAELAGGAAGAVVIPLLLGLTWGRLWRAGMVMCVGLALLLHPTAALLVLTGLYRVTELVVGRFPRVALALFGLFVAAAVLTLGWSLR